MAYVDWMIKGPKISSCSCNYGCPCEFNALPTHDVCEGLEALRIDGGFFGDLRLDGIVIARVSTGQVPVHEGGGISQGVIDSSASQEQIAPPAVRR